MATPSLVTLVNSNQYNQTGSIVAVSNFTTATDISPGSNIAGLAFQTSPAQLFPGQLWRFTANGIYSLSGSPGLSIGVYFGGAAGSPLCYGSVGAASTTANAASAPWQLHAVGRLVQPGTSAIWNVIGNLSGVNSSGAVTMMPSNTTPNGTWDTASAHFITLASTCTVASATNLVAVYNWAIECLTEP